MSVDIYHSRRTNYYRCVYWVRDERTSTGNAAKWVLDKKCSGCFYAKPVSVESNQMNTINGTWALDRDNIAIETDDKVNDLKRGCIVKYDNNLWLVESIQAKIHLKKSEFSKHTDYRTTIIMTRG